MTDVKDNLFADIAAILRAFHPEATDEEIKDTFAKLTLSFFAPTESGSPSTDPAQRPRQIVEDLASLHDDMRMLTAIIMRQERTLTALLTEARATQREEEYDSDPSV